MVDGGGIEMRSHTPGHAGSRLIELTPDGFVWAFQMDKRTMRYTIRVKDGVWREVGEMVEAGKPPVQFFQMTLKRVGGTGWPAENAAFPTK